MNVLLADQHSHTRLGLEMLLNREPGVSIVGSAGNGAGLLALAQSTAPDVIILEDPLPGLPVRKLIARLRTENPDVKIILMCNDTVECKSHSSDETICVKKGDPPAVVLTVFRSLCKSLGHIRHENDSSRR